MSKFYLDSKKMQDTLNEVEQCITILQNSANEVQNVNKELKKILKIEYSRVINAHLKETENQLRKHQESLKRFVDMGRQIVITYQNIERKLAGIILQFICFWHDTAGNFGKRDTNASVRKKDKFIRDFEKKHPEEAERLNEFLSGENLDKLTPNDIRNIKYLVYTAEEPYRSIYLKSLKNKYKIASLDGVVDGKPTSFYMPGEHTVTYAYEIAFGEDPRGPYTTFFHECGHAIDDLSDESNCQGSDTENFKAYSEEMGKNVTLYEAIEYDVYYNKNNPHSVTSIAEKMIKNKNSCKNGNIDNVIEAFRTGKKDRLSKQDLNLYNAIKYEFYNTTGKDGKYEAVTDIYGGMSKNELINQARDGGYCHTVGYWEIRENTQKAKELWAEYFSYNMAGNQESLDNLKEYFPEAAKIMEQYAYALAS